MVNIMKYGQLLFCVMLILLPSSLKAQPLKHEVIQELLHIGDDLYQQALLCTTKEHHREFNHEVGEMAQQFLVPFTTPEQLGRIALLAWAIYSPGNARDVKFDAMFFHTYDHSIAKLARSITEEHYRVLKELECHTMPQGGERLSFNEILWRFEEVLAKPPTIPDPSEFALPEPEPEKELTEAERQELLQEALRILEESPSPEELFAQSEQEDIPPKSERIRTILTILHAIYEQALHLQKHEPTSADIRQVIEPIVALLQIPEELGRLATITWEIYAYGDTREARFDSVFFYTYRLCIERLAENPSRETYMELEYLNQCTLCLNEEEKQFFDEQLHNVITHLKQIGQWPPL